MNGMAKMTKKRKTDNSLLLICVPSLAFAFPFLWLHSHLHNSKRTESGSISSVYKERSYTVLRIDRELKINLEHMSNRGYNSISSLN